MNPHREERSLKPAPRCAIYSSGAMAERVRIHLERIKECGGRDGGDGGQIELAFNVISLSIILQDISYKKR